ncbi:MAG: 1-acyl-sn-glycerol-3-phosphate acyltransferase [Deltaproteobacteria bacterium]|nr:MAG: 1-acyl-sn-glycerol-3-phosphate acyltransferase [Deltaproteobacteria bacterium]
MNYLTTQNTYRSPNLPVSRFAQNFPSLIFYAKMLLVVLKASKLSKKGEYTGEKWVQSSLDIVKALESVGVPFEIENVAVHQKLGTPCVFVANHMSILETFVLPCLIQPYRDVTFVVKESLISYPFFKHVIMSRDPIVVGRVNPRQDLKDVLEEGQKRLSVNVSIIVFPQTTRSVYFDTTKFNTLGVKLAKRAGVPVIPIALKTDAWGLGRRLKDFGKINPKIPVRICFGDPLAIKDSGREEHNKIVAFISGKLNDWH